MPNRLPNNTRAATQPDAPVPACVNSSLAALSDRALSMGLFTYRASSDGRLFSALFDARNRQDWMYAAEILDLLAPTASASAEASSHWNGTVITARLCGVGAGDDELRLIGFTPAAFEQPQWTELARRFAPSNLSLPFARGEASLRSAIHTIELMAGDLRESASLRRTLDGCTAQLAAGMEAIDLLTFLGRNLHDFSQPSRFLAEACLRLRRALPAAWAAAWINPASSSWTIGTRAIEISGNPGVCNDALRTHASNWLRLVSSPTKPIAWTSLETSVGVLRPRQRVLLHRLSRTNEPLGLLALSLPAGSRETSAQSQLISSTAGYLSTFFENAALYREQQAHVLGSLRALSASIEAKDPCTSGHSSRVASLASDIARHAGMDALMVRRAHLCGLVHDIGKIGVPEHVLQKPGALNEEEMTHIRRHPRAGFEILKDLPSLQELLPGVLHHHERWDGRGYPTGLAMNDIPLLARIIAVADAFDAMSSARPYRAAMSRDKVLQQMHAAAGAQLDPDLVEVLLDMDLASYDAAAAHPGPDAAGMAA